MEFHSRERISIVLFSLLFVLVATYRTLLFYQQFQKHEIVGEQKKIIEDVLIETEPNWNWTLFAKKGFHMNMAQCPSRDQNLALR